MCMSCGNQKVSAEAVMPTRPWRISIWLTAAAVTLAVVYQTLNQLTG